MAKAAKKTAADTTDKYASGMFQPVIDKCTGCGHIVEANAQQFCQTYVTPAAKWRLGICNFATHVKPEIITAKTRVNPLKASKRAAGKKK